MHGPGPRGPDAGDPRDPHGTQSLPPGNNRVFEPAALVTGSGPRAGAHVVVVVGGAPVVVVVGGAIWGWTVIVRWVVWPPEPLAVSV